MQIGRRFALSDQPGEGVYCDESGLFVGGVALLERFQGDSFGWQPRPLPELNRDLGRRYGLPVELNAKLGGLTAIARALSRCDLIHARIATLHLRLPDPPAVTQSFHSTKDVVDFARQLKASGLLKADWDPAKHPRWPAGSPGSVGGEFAPGDSEGGASAPPDRGEANLPLIPTQGATTLPIPFRLPGQIPFPSEVLPPPVIAPNINPLTIPRNPYPERPRCVREWEEATKDCLDLWSDGLLGTDNYRGMGRTVGECIMGRVSEYCGGNRLDA
jgi:hypothetical protein